MNLTFRYVITRTLHQLLKHKKTRRILEEMGYELLENKKTRPICEAIFLRAILKYGDMTKKHHV